MEAVPKAGDAAAPGAAGQGGDLSALQRQPQPGDEGQEEEYEGEYDEQYYDPNQGVDSALIQPTSQCRGVCWIKKSRKWTARICQDGKQHYLGSFDVEEDAAKACDAAALEKKKHQALST
jgi:hypothetical protein